MKTILFVLQSKASVSKTHKSHNIVQQFKFSVTKFQENRSGFFLEPRTPTKTE